MPPNLLGSFDELEPAFRFIASGSIGKNVIWAIAKLYNTESNNKRYWVTHSTQNVVQVIGGEIRAPLERANEALTGRPLNQLSVQERNDLNVSRRTINENIAAYVGQQGLAGPVGHAEERLIMGWDQMIREYAERFNGESPDAVTLYLSDSPCTIHDGDKASDNIPGKPKSCFAKIELLGHEKQSISKWDVFFRKKWGMLQQKKQGKADTAERWADIQTGQAVVNQNPKYKAFPPELEKQAIAAGLKAV